MKKGDAIVGHVTEGLCQPFFHMLKEGTATEIKLIATGEPRPSAVGTFVQGGGIEISCPYKVYGHREN